MKRELEKVRPKEILTWGESFNYLPVFLLKIPYSTCSLESSLERTGKSNQSNVDYDEKAIFSDHILPWLQILYAKWSNSI